MTPASRTRQEQAVIAEWARSPSRARRIAAALAAELPARPHGTRLESSMRIAKRFETNNSMAVRARRFLLGANFIYKNDSDRRYYVA